MGAGQGRPVGCVLRNQSGRDVRALCGPAAAELESQVLEHGGERALEAPSCQGGGLELALQLGEDDVRTLRVPPKASLVLRRNGGTIVLRIWRPELEAYEAPEYVEIPALRARLLGMHVQAGGSDVAAIEAAALSPSAATGPPAAEPALAAAAEPAAEAVPAPGVPPPARPPTETPAPAAEVGGELELAQLQTPAPEQPRREAGAEDGGDGACTSSASVPIDVGPAAAAASAPTPALAGGSVASCGGQVPLECVCPISQEVFVDPVLAADGFTYERECIEEWWRRRGCRSPMTGQELSSTSLTPNIAIRALAEEHRGRQPVQFDAADGFGGFYERHLPALAEMFAHLGEEKVREVCAALSASGVEDVDACVRQLLQCAGPSGEAAVVSLAPVCCASGRDDADVAAAAALLDPAMSVPEEWSAEQEDLFAEMLGLNIPPVRARKAIELGAAEDIEEAVIWIEKHQEDADIDTPIEVLKEREAAELWLEVLRVATVPAVHRLECLRALHQVLGRILADPGSERLRKLRLQNPKFRERIGRFPQALALLRRIGFVQGDYWVSAFQREPCLEFRCPVDSDNPASQRFVRAYSLLDEVLRAPEDWLPMVPEALPEVQSDWARLMEGAGEPAPGDAAGAAAQAAAGAGPSRAFLAELHERRARDPRGFMEAMRAAGKRPNRVVVDVRQRAEAEGGASSSSGSGQRYRRLSERFGGRREFNLQDIEAMRVEEAIAGCPRYAQEYDNEHGQARSYGDLVTRMYDPAYLGRKALDETNVFRGQQSAPPLRWSQALADIATTHAQQMARGEMPFSHKGFDERVRRYPFPHMSVAENLAMNGGTADAAGVAVQGWIKSPGHRKNLLGAFDLCGIGVARSSAGQFFFTQLFARTVGGSLC